MKKITDIIIEVDGTKESRDPEGNLVREKVKKKVKRKVNVVSGGKRFGHYILDAILAMVILFGLSIAYYTINPPDIYSTDGGIDLSGYIAIFIYYFAFELALGKTPGKYVTKCRVINEYCEKPNANDIFIRSISRLVPFEGFSCLGERGWHDKWSKTYLVSEDEYQKLKTLLGKSDVNNDILDANL